MHIGGVSGNIKVVHRLLELITETYFVGCDVFFMCKNKYKPEGPCDISKDTFTLVKVIILGLVFMIQKLNDKAIIYKISGTWGEQEYLLVYDHHTGNNNHVSYIIHKTLPKWLNKCLSCLIPSDTYKKYVAVDWGG